jgi:hypothetical protein
VADRFDCLSRSAIRRIHCNPNAETSFSVQRHRSGPGISSVESAEDGRRRQDSGDFLVTTAAWLSKTRFLWKIFIEILEGVYTAFIAFLSRSDFFYPPLSILNEDFSESKPMKPHNPVSMGISPFYGPWLHSGDSTVPEDHLNRFCLMLR